MTPENAPAPQQPRRPGAVTVLALVLALLLTIWCVGTILLVRYGPDLPEIPTSPSPTDERFR